MEQAMKAQVTVQNGNKEVTITVTGARAWEGGENVRTYYDIEQDNRRSVLNSLYEVVQGSTRDSTIEVAGRTFGYQFGVDANSKTKRAAAIEAIESLITQIT